MKYFQFFFTTNVLITWISESNSDIWTFDWQYIHIIQSGALGTKVDGKWEGMRDIGKEVKGE